MIKFPNGYLFSIENGSYKDQAFYFLDLNRELRESEYTDLMHDGMRNMYAVLHDGQNAIQSKLLKPADCPEAWAIAFRNF